MHPEYQSDDNDWISSSDVHPSARHAVEACFVGPYIHLRVAGQEPLRISPAEWSNFLDGARKGKFEIEELIKPAVKKAMSEME